MAFVPKETQDQLVKLHKIIDKLELDNEKLGREISRKDYRVRRSGRIRSAFILLFIVAVSFVASLFIFPRYFFYEFSEDRLAYEHLSNEYATIRSEKIELEASIDSIREAYSSVIPKEEVVVPSIESMRLVYTIQIGAFKRFRFPLISDNLIGFTVKYKKEWVKFSLGIFSTHREALILSNNLKKVGIGNPFIQAYKNGVAVNLKTALRYEKEMLGSK